MTHQRIVWADSAVECRSYMKQLTLTICTVLTALAISVAHGQSSSSLDEHLDLPAGFATEQADPGVDGKNQIDLSKMGRGGLDASDVDVGKVWSGNWIRVLREVEKLRGGANHD